MRWSSASCAARDFGRFAERLLPGKVGTIAGLFFGFAFGMAGIAAAVLGKLADHTSIEFVVKVCAFLPLIGLLTGLLPNLKEYEHGPQSK